jgi:hypothetical protein
MQVVNPRAALLSNIEVLHLLRELEADHLASQKSALRIKKEEEQAGSQNQKNLAQNDQVSENLRTIEVEVSFRSFPLLSRHMLNSSLLRLFNISLPATSHRYRCPKLVSKSLSRHSPPSG